MFAHSGGGRTIDIPAWYFSGRMCVVNLSNVEVCLRPPPDVMRSIIKVSVVLVAFSALFFGLRMYGIYVGYDVATLVSDVGGLAYLYSTVGTIFAIFAAFVIVSESQDWNTLNGATKNEVRDLSELLSWSKRLSPYLAEKFASNIKQYLAVVIETEWKSLEKGIESPETEPLIEAFHDLISEASKESHDIASHMFTSFDEFLNHRATRIEYSWQPLPAILKFTVRGSYWKSTN